MIENRNCKNKCWHGTAGVLLRWQHIFIWLSLSTLFNCCYSTLAAVLPSIYFICNDFVFSLPFVEWAHSIQRQKSKTLTPKMTMSTCQMVWPAVANWSTIAVWCAVKIGQIYWTDRFTRHQQVNCPRMLPMDYVCWNWIRYRKVS